MLEETTWIKLQVDDNKGRDDVLSMRHCCLSVLDVCTMMLFICKLQTYCWWIVWPATFSSLRQQTRVCLWKHHFKPDLCAHMSFRFSPCLCIIFHSLDLKQIVWGYFKSYLKLWNMCSAFALVIRCYGWCLLFDNSSSIEFVIQVISLCLI